MLESIFFTTFLVQIFYLLNKKNSSLSKFIYLSIISNILLYLIVKLKLPSLLKGMLGLPKTISYTLLFLWYSFFWLQLKKTKFKLSQIFFISMLVFFFISVTIEYLSVYNLIKIKNYEFYEDVFMFLGLTCWLMVFTFQFNLSKRGGGIESEKK